MINKKPLLVSAIVAAAGLTSVGTVGLVSADNANGSRDSSLVDRLSSKYNLDKTEVQAVFDEERKEHRTERRAERTERINQAVKDGNITQAQADHITGVLAEVEKLRGDTVPHELSDEVREQIRDKMHELREWAEENKVDLQYVGHGGKGHGERGMGGMQGRMGQR